MNQSPQQQQQQKQHQKFQKIAENSENLPKIRRKFLKKKVFFEALISHCYHIVSRKNPHIVSISYQVKKKAYRPGVLSRVKHLSHIDQTICKNDQNSEVIQLFDTYNQIFVEGNLSYPKYLG